MYLWNGYNVRVVVAAVKGEVRKQGSCGTSVDHGAVEQAALEW